MIWPSFYSVLGQGYYNGTKESKKPCLQHLIEQSDELAFYISNGEPQKDHGYFYAVRNHWSVEVSNHIRDVSLREDLFKTKKSLLLAS